MPAIEGDLRERIGSAKILVIGAGGIGCELLKNLVLTGFRHIEVVDLDTIDVSNLNRQFLFQKQHVGKSKAAVAAESVLQFCPSAHVKHHHSNIMSAEFNVEFFKQFSLVLNALDNRAARNHVNRLCLAANVVLIESGSAGYLGQVTVIKKGVTECYECTPKKGQRSYPGCTIRNTPSEPIHCIVWAKHLFNQLFGEADIDEDVSPDTADPEAANAEVRSEENGSAPEGLEAASDSANGTQRISTRQWATDKNYDPKELFKKLFADDISYLLSMSNLWKKRNEPMVLKWEQLPDEHPGGSSSSGSSWRPTLMKDQIVWTAKECAEFFEQTVKELRRCLSEKPQGNVLVWDKDDATSVHFVTACANLRAYVFGIPLQSVFDVKSMAGDIIPAIATTNAIVAGMIVMEALKVIDGCFDQCRCVFITRKPNPRSKILVDQVLDKPNPKCYVCSNKPEVYVELDTTACTIKHLEDKVLKESLNMVAPDVSLDDGSGTIIISSEEGETDALQGKTLAELKVHDGVRLQCDDYMQKFELRLIILHRESIEDGADFRIVSSIADLKPEAETGATQEHDGVSDLVAMDDATIKVSALKRTAAEIVSGSPETKRHRTALDT